ncbi:MAG: xanthine dehydrogenase family protein molybdopterin-binding subunit [Atribacterota bacterium]|jgi:CO/xanthine dehydrogenase Mo-binding subunit|nr:xanthine dehydrogenase family protein molybdopterin-binding subunit [Atribacterota bacterium]MDD5636683.1 xanthine dehydrogenase family protein molybdopterin-binding subunit [Atribacterota bacterium]
MSKLKIIGQPIPRYDARSKVTGSLKYADDFSLPGMLYGKVLRSIYPAAEIISIDTTVAKKLEGVHAVLTAKDVPHNETVTRFGQSTEVGKGFEGLYRVLADKKVRFMGEAVALVAAETEEIAEQALDLIKVDYKPLPGVFDPVEAMKLDAYLVGENNSNIIGEFGCAQGDVEKGFAEADVIIEDTYKVTFQDHAFMEPESGIGWIDDYGVLCLRVSSQVIEHFRDVADVLGIPHNKVRYIGTLMGGGFGGKEDITVESYLALLTWYTKKPVRLVYNRDETFMCHSKRHPFVMHYKVGAKKDGKLVALEAYLISDSGGYPYLSPWVTLYATVNAAGPYVIPNVKVKANCVLTNNTFTSANRGFGAPQPNVAYESIMDELAHKLNIDPLEIRRRNCLTTGKALSTTGQVFNTHVALPEAAEKAWEALGKPAISKDANIKIGQGLAIGLMSYGRMTFLHDTSRSYVKLESDGSVLIRSGIPDLGGGQISLLCQIAAEELGVPMSKIRIYHSDTALTPLAGTTTATRQCYMSGNATLKAAREVRSRILKKAAEILNVNQDNLDIIEENVIVTYDPSQYVPLGKVIRTCDGAGIELFCEAQFNAPFTTVPDLSNMRGTTFPDFTFGSQGAEVAVDIETGQVKVTKIVTCYDIGKALNLAAVEGQMEGGSIYGMGYALFENYELEKGFPKTLSFAEYRIPSSLDVPEVKTIVLESGGGLGPYGAKGIGEPACSIITPAILNAIYNAVGVRIKTLPVTPDKILKALKGNSL